MSAPTSQTTGAASGNVRTRCEVVPAHPRRRSGLSVGIGEALDVTMWLLIQAPDGPAARPVVTDACGEGRSDPSAVGAGAGTSDADGTGCDTDGTGCGVGGAAWRSAKDAGQL